MLERFLGPSGQPSHGARVVAGQRRLQAATDVLLGSAVGPGGRHWYVRQLQDQKASAVVEAMTDDDLATWGELCGWALARGHARSGEPSTIAGYLGDDDAFDHAHRRVRRGVRRPDRTRLRRVHRRDRVRPDRRRDRRLGRPARPPRPTSASPARRLVRIFSSFRTSSTTISERRDEQADRPLVGRQAGRPEDPLQEPELRGQDDRQDGQAGRHQERTVRRGWTRSNIDSSASAVSSDEKRRNSENVVTPMVRATTSPNAPLDQARTPRVPTAITRP